MIDKKQYENGRDKIKMCYIIFLIIYFFAHHSPYTYRLFNHTIFEIIIIVLTMSVVVPDLLRLKAYFRIKHMKWILAMLVCIGISNLLNLDAGLMGNARFYFWIVVYGLVIYPMFARRSKEDNWKAVKIINVTFIICAFLLSFLSILSIYIPFPKVQNAYYASGIYTIPFYAKRFFGIYSDPNIGSLIGILAICASIILLNDKKKLVNREKSWMRILLCFNIIIQIGYIFCCDSRGGKLALMISAFCGCMIWNTCTKERKDIQCIGKAILFSILLCVLIFVLGTGIKEFTKHTYTVKIEDTEINKEGYGRTDKEASSQIRLIMWGQAVKAVKEKPLFGGTALGTGNILKNYATKETKKMMSGANLHNVYLYGLLTTGILATVIWMILIFFIAKRTFCYCYGKETDEREKKKLSVMITMFLAMHIMAFFFNILYVVPGIITMCHWAMLGILTGITHEEQKKILVG